MKKVQTGDRLHIPAATWNTLLDVAQERQARSQNQSGEAQPHGLPAGIVLVKNVSGADRARFDILGIGGPIFTPTVSEQAFTDRVALSGVAPTEDDHLGRFVVCAEPVKSGNLGRAWVFGVCQVQVDLGSDGSAAYADVVDGAASHLKGRPWGGSRIIWQPPAATGVQWCLVRLGDPSAGETLPMGTVMNWDGAATDAAVEEAWGPKWCRADGRPVSDARSIYHGRSVPDSAGRTIVGLDSSNEAFDTPGKTGGTSLPDQKHALGDIIAGITIADHPAHSHPMVLDSTRIADVEGFTLQGPVIAVCPTPQSDPPDLGDTADHSPQAHTWQADGPDLTHDHLPYLVCNRVVKWLP